MEKKMGENRILCVFEGSTTLNPSTFGVIMDSPGKK